MEPNSFFHVALKVPDIERSTAFYRDLFDAEILTHAVPDDSSDVEYVALAVADKRVYLFDRAPYEASGHVDGPLPFGFLHYGFVVDDLEAAHGSFVDAGVEFLMEPTVLGDLYIAFLTDPAGVRVELLEHR